MEIGEFILGEVINAETLKVCGQIKKVVRIKEGGWKHEDQRLVFGAAMISVRLGEPGRRWLDSALAGVRMTRPDNTAAHFKTCLAIELRDLDPGIRSDAQAKKLFGGLLKKLSLPTAAEIQAAHEALRKEDPP